LEGEEKGCQRKWKGRKAVPDLGGRDPISPDRSQRASRKSQEAECAHRYPSEVVMESERGGPNV